MAVKTVERYLCSDGKIFTSKTDANDHETNTTIRNDIEKILGSFYFHSMTLNGLVDEFIEYADEFREALG